VYFFLGGRVTSRPRSKFKLINEGPLYGFQAQAKFNQRFEFRRE